MRCWAIWTLQRQLAAAKVGGQEVGAGEWMGPGLVCGI